MKAIKLTHYRLGILRSMAGRERLWSDVGWYTKSSHHVIARSARDCEALWRGGYIEPAGDKFAGGEQSYRLTAKGRDAAKDGAK